jgi:hypothetical protein
MTNMHITIWNVIKITKKVEERSKNVHIKLEAQSNSILSMSQNPGVGCTKSIWDILHIHGKLRR